MIGTEIMTTGGFATRVSIAAAKSSPVVGKGLVTSAERLTILMLTLSKYLAFLAVIGGAVLYMYRGSTNYRRWALGMMYGGGATLVVYFALGFIYSTLAFLMRFGGAIPNNGSAMLSPTMMSWSFKQSGTITQAAGAISQIGRLIGQGFIALGAAFHAIGRPKRTFDENGKSLLSAGVGLILISLGGWVFAVVIYILKPIL